MVIDTGINMELLRLDGFCVGGFERGEFISYEELRAIEEQANIQHAPAPVTVVEPEPQVKPEPKPENKPEPKPESEMKPASKPELEIISAEKPSQGADVNYDLHNNAPVAEQWPAQYMPPILQYPPMPVEVAPHQGDYYPLPMQTPPQPLISYGGISGEDISSMERYDQYKGLSQGQNGLPKEAKPIADKPKRRMADAFTTEELELLRGGDAAESRNNRPAFSYPADSGAPMPAPVALDSGFGYRDRPFELDYLNNNAASPYRMPRDEGRVLEGYYSSWGYPGGAVNYGGHLSNSDFELLNAYDRQELDRKYEGLAPFPTRPGVTNDRGSAFAPDLSPDKPVGRGGLSRRDMELMSEYESFLGGKGRKDGFYGFDLPNGDNRAPMISGLTHSDIGYMSEFDQRNLGQRELSLGYRPQSGVLSFNPGDVVNMSPFGATGYGLLGIDGGHAEWELTQLDRYMRETEIRRNGLASFGAQGEFGAIFSHETAMYDRYLNSKMNGRPTVGAPSDGLAYLLSTQLGIAPEYSKKEARSLRRNTEKRDNRLIIERHRYHVSKLELTLDSASLTFAKQDRENGREVRRAERELEFWSRREKKAIIGQRSDNERYYSAVMLDPRRSRLPKRASREELALQRQRLISLIKERDSINERLAALYRGGSGGRQTYEQKKDAYVRRRVRKVYYKQKQLADEISSYRLPLSKKEQVFALMDRRTALSAEIAGAEYALKHSKLKGKARREKVKSVRKSRRALRKCEARIAREGRRLIAKGRDKRRSFGFEAFGWIVLLCIIGLSVLGYIFRNELMAFLPTVKQWLTPG